MRKVVKEVGTRDTKLGEVAFPVYDSLQEMITLFGEDTVYKLAMRAVTIDTERIARDGFKGEKPKTAEEVQALLDAYKPGGSRGTGKPSLKTLMAKLTLLGEKAKKDKAALDVMVKAGQLFTDEGIEAAMNYITEAGY